MKKSAKINVVDYSNSISPIGDTLGLLNRAEAALILANKNMIRPMASASKDEMDRLKAAINDYDKEHPEMDTTVYLGGAPWPWDRIKSVFKSKGIERKLGNTIGALTDPFISATRNDSYQPLGDYVTLFAPDEAILRHELGHALNRTNSKSGLMYLAKRDLPEAILNTTVAAMTGTNSGLTPFEFAEEASASTNALRSMNDNDYQKKRLAATTLGLALGTYGSRLAKGMGRLVAPKLTDKIYDILNPEFNIPGITPHLEKIKDSVRDYFNRGRETIKDVKELKRFDQNVKTILNRIPTKYTFPGASMLGAGLTGLATYALSGTDLFKNLMSSRSSTNEETEKISSLKHGQMEANAAMIKEIAGQGDMERVAPGIDPEVISAIASILAMDGNGDSQEDMEALLKDNPEIIEEML